MERLLAARAASHVPPAPEGEPATGDVPTLFVEGLHDTNRRPENGRVATVGYPHATVAEFRDRAHVALDACAVELVEPVLADSASAPDPGCIPAGGGFSPEAPLAYSPFSQFGVASGVTGFEPSGGGGGAPTCAGGG